MDQLQVAVVGAGPAGFYAAGALLKNSERPVAVDIFDRLPAPHGLVRYGVAPDHAKIKSVARIYEKTLADDRVRYFGNVDVGEDLSLAELHAHYHAVILAVGAQADRALGIEGEALTGSMSATEFVAWYNGHPDFRDLEPDLSARSVAVIGMGNVAMDVARILVRTPDELKDTDIADHALEALSKSRVETVYVLGRRGPAQAKFTNPEIKEFAELDDADVSVRAADLVLDPQSKKDAEADRGIERNLEVLQEFSERGPQDKARRVAFRFKCSPVEILGKDGAVGGLRVRDNELRAEDGWVNAVPTDRVHTLDVGMVMRSVGYRGVEMPGVPFDARRAVVPNDAGRVRDGDTAVEGLYVTGWFRRGPSGVIGTNKPDAVEVVTAVLEDIGTGPLATRHDVSGIDALLRARNVRWISTEDWHRLDAAEQALGEAQGRPRVKIVRREDVFRTLDA